MEDNILSANLAENDERHILIIKLQGMFYNAYENNAKVLSQVTNYKIKQPTKNAKLKCGFPSNAADKVARQLREAGVSFAIMNKDIMVAGFWTSENAYEALLESFPNERIVRSWEEKIDTDDKKVSGKSVKETNIETNVNGRNIFSWLSRIIGKTGNN